MVEERKKLGRLDGSMDTRMDEFKINRNMKETEELMFEEATID